MSAQSGSYLSCAFDRLYPAGVGLHTEDQGLSDIRSRDPVSFGVHWIAQCFPAAWYGRPVDRGMFVDTAAASAVLGPFYAAQAMKSVAASGLVKIDQALVYNSLLWAGSPPMLIYETYRYNDRDAAVLPTFDDNRIVRFRAAKDTRYLLIASAGSSNYGHFLIDDLPRLAALDPLDSSSCRLAVLMTRWSPEIDLVRSDAVQMLTRGRARVEWLDAGVIYAIDELFYPSPVSDHPWRKSPPAIARLRDRAVPTPVPKPSRRLFVMRPPSNERALINVDELSALLQDRGFELVRPEQLDFSRQVQLFAEAAIIIGEMGAAMTNCVFAQVGTPLLYLAPQGWIEPFYWDLAEVGCQRYHVIFGDAMGPEQHAHKRCYTIDAQKLTGWCDGVIRGRNDGSTSGNEVT